MLCVSVFNSWVFEVYRLAMALFDANKIYGLANKNSKLKEGDVIEIRRLLFKTEETYKKIGKKFNVSAACVMQIAKGRTWKWLKPLE